MAHGRSPRHTRRKRAPAEGATTTESPRTSAHGGLRLQKLLAAAGFGSRREVERYLDEGRVTVDGRVAALGDRADLEVQDVRVDGERLVRERPAYWLLNKPRGVVTTVRDESGRRTVLDLLPPDVGRVFPVGRLDRETTGLLLLTNDGDTAHALLHPSLGNEREYRVTVKGLLDDRGVRRLERGVSLEEGRTAPARLADLRHDVDAGTSSFTLTLVEGRKRQIRRSLLVLGFPVHRLSRVRMGPLRLGRLAVGAARPLRGEERRALLDHVERLRRGEAPRGGRDQADPGGRPAKIRRDEAGPGGRAAKTRRDEAGPGGRTAKKTRRDDDRGKRPSKGGPAERRQGSPKGDQPDRRTRSPKGDQPDRRTRSPKGDQPDRRTRSPKGGPAQRRTRSRKGVSR